MQTRRPDPNPSALSRSSSLAVGSATLLASGVFRQCLGFATLAITARLLRPEDFGILAYFFIAAALLEMLQRQIGMVLIRIDKISPDYLNTVFTFQLLFGFGAASFFWVMQPVIALLGIPELVDLLPAISALSIVIAIRSPRFLLYERGLRFSLAAAEETLNRVTYAVVAVYLTWLWRDSKAIIIAVFVGMAMRSLITFAVAPMRPRLSLSRWRESFSFMSWAIGAQFSQFLANSVPQLFIGATLGLADAGIYRIGSRITEIVTTQFFAPLQRVIYPGLADISRSTDRREATFTLLNECMLAIVLPVSVGAALVSKDVILFGLGFKWIAAAQVIWILAPLKALETLQANVRAASYVEGSTKTLFLRNSLLMALVCLYMWIGTQFGFYGALAAAGLSSFTALTITLILAKRFGNGGFFEPLKCAWRSFLACAVMVAAVLAVDVMMRSGVHTPRILVIVLTKVSVGVVVYTMTHIALWGIAKRPAGFESRVFSLLFRFRAQLCRSRI